MKVKNRYMETKIKKDIIEVFCEQHAITKQILIDVYLDYLKKAVDTIQSKETIHGGKIK